LILDRFDGKTTKPLPPVYPKVSGKGRGMTLKLEDGRHYQVPENSAACLETLRHLSGKTWATEEFMNLTIARVAAARDWDPEPLAMMLDA
jgi:hypothetical protein